VPKNDKKKAIDLNFEFEVDNSVYGYKVEKKPLLSPE